MRVASHVHGDHGEMTGDGVGVSFHPVEICHAAAPARSYSDARDVETVLSFLPKKEREVMERRYFQDQARFEIAADLGVSAGYVSQLQARAISRIRERIGLACAA